MTFFESSSRSIFLFEHDLFGKPVPTFPDHALAIIGATIARLRRPDRREKTLDLLLRALGLLCGFAGRTGSQFFNWLGFKRRPGGGALARPAET